MKYWGGFGKTNGIHIGTNSLVENIIGLKIKQRIWETIIQQETVVKNKNGYQKLVFEEDFRHGEQSESEESSKLPITKHPKLKEFKEDSKHEEQSEIGESSEQPIMECRELEEFKEDSKHEEQSKPEESNEQPITEHQDQEVCLKEGSKRYLCCCDFSDYLYGDYDD
ncbi:MAG: uncharacterized protein A8A55_2882 [Amphiamblys sp. WSBS2006]|nr:MAG: uncharacterized protein A8A55_2882 [Amphiamblys sp. WSBS2006]